MRLWRSAVYLTAAVFGTMFFGGTVIAAALLRVRQRPNSVYDWAPRWWARTLIWAAGTPITVTGFDQVPRDRPVVYVANHQSWFDILALAASLPGTHRFVAKKEMKKVPLLGWSMRASGQLFIDRQNRQAAVGSLDETSQLIQQGTSAMLFPEGTRSRTGDLLPFKKGPFVLALSAKVPVVPVYCARTFDILPKGSVLLRPHPIELRFGAPISTAGLQYDDRERLMTEARQAIEGLRARGPA